MYKRGHSILFIYVCVCAHIQLLYQKLNNMLFVCQIILYSCVSSGLYTFMTTVKNVSHTEKSPSVFTHCVPSVHRFLSSYMVSYVGCPTLSLCSSCCWIDFGQICYGCLYEGFHYFSERYMHYMNNQNWNIRL